MLQVILNVRLFGAVEYRGFKENTQFVSGKSKHGFEDLSDVHPRRNTKRIQYDIQWRAIIHEGHIFFGHNASHHALVSVTAGHLVAHLQLSLASHIDLYHGFYTGREFIPFFPGVHLNVDYDTFRTVGHTQRSISNFASFLPENAM